MKMASTVDLVAESVPDLTKQQKSKKPFWQMNFRKTVSYVKEIITVEPLICAYYVASFLCGPALTNLEFEKACRVNLKFNDSVCEAILSGEHGNVTEQNDQVQILVSNMHSWQQPVQNVVPLILVLFLGSYSDRHKLRKPFLILPVIGEFFAIIGCILCVVFMDTWPLEAQAVAQTVISSFFGGQTMLAMAVFAYIADVSTVEMRTFRIGVVQITLNICFPLVQLFSGILFKKIGYYGVLLIAVAIFAFGVFYGIFYIKEPKQPTKDPNKGLLRDIFHPRHAIDTFYLLFKKNPENNRVYIFLVLITIFIYNGVSTGELNLFFLYVQSQLSWTVVEFSYLITFNTVIHLIGTALGVPLLTKLLKLSDPTILILTFADKIIANVIFGFATTNALMYAGVFISLLTGITAIGIRSLATKIVSENDLGKAQSLFSMFEAVAPAVMTPIYNIVIYNNTLTTVPGAFFFFGALLNLLCCVIIAWLYIHEKRKKRREEKNNAAKENPIPMESYVQTTHM